MKSLDSTEFNFLLLAGVARVVMWLAFAVFHLILAVSALFLLWWWQVPPSQFLGFLASIPDDKHVQWIALAGCSGASILALYCWCWKRIYTKLTTPYIFRGARQAVGRA